jgi:hypothetical protein
MTSTLINVAETFGLTDDQTLAGPSPLTRRQYTPRRRQAIKEAADLWKRVFDGDIRAAVQVKEALSTSDLFVSATGDVLDRELLAQYTSVQAEWAGFATRTLVRNFKPKKLIDILGGRTVLERVPELTAYPGAEYDTREFAIAVAKFGRQFGFSWEAMVNDDLDELMQIPGTFAQAAALTEDNAALAVIANVTTGAPNTAFFKDYSAIDTYGTLNTAPVSAVLNEANLQTAIEAIKQRKDAEGNLVPSGPLILVVGPAQDFTARRILNATEIRVTSGSRTTLEPNPLKGAVELVVLSRLPGLAWFVLPKPSTAARPALAVAFLRGFETPDIRQKANAGNSLGGGALSPDSGDFDDDSVRYRVRHVTGAASADPIHTYAATGAA